MGKNKGLFRKVALIKVGNTGVSATGFIVDELDENHSTVFIPCGAGSTQFIPENFFQSNMHKADS